MTPAARWAAAARIMDQITAGSPAEKALTNWARKSRFAGSKDRAAVRDHVFDILRCWRSAASSGGGTDGRRLVLGRLRQIGEDPATVFTGDGYAPEPLSDDDKVGGSAPTGAAEWDLPDWLFDLFVSELGADSKAVAQALTRRAKVFLRVNALKSDVETAQAALADAGIKTVRHPLAANALEVTDGARRIAQSTPYLTGCVELQDAASQAVVEALPLENGAHVLDYCAGGGGKTLAMAARVKGPIEAHDSDPRRMSDLPKRAARAGVRVDQVARPKGPYDLVLCDVPCSGSGAWRRSPEGKWRLTPEKLSDLLATQARILDECTEHVAPVGCLAYATCSVLPCENTKQIQEFLTRHSGWVLSKQRQFLPQDGGDGFFVAILTRSV